MSEKFEYKNNYDPSILVSIPRSIQRTQNKIKIIFTGFDIWNAFEFSWLNTKGKPEVRILRIAYSSDSINIVESKSLKYYLNSFAMSKFINETEVIGIIKKDLSNILNTPFIEIQALPYNKTLSFSKIPDNMLLDNLDINGFIRVIYLSNINKSALFWPFPEFEWLQFLNSYHSAYSPGAHFYQL